jgi:toxin secretion/phage lysis holin
MAERIITKSNTIFGVLATVLAGTFGDLWFLWVAFLVLNVVDYITGCLKAKFTGTENSVKGVKGIIKKVGYWVVIAIAFFVALSLEKMGGTLGIQIGYLQLLGWFTLATFIINEIRSILENLVELGVDHIPPFLLKGLEVAEQAIKNNTEEEENEDLD